MKRIVRLTLPLALGGLLASCGMSPQERFERGKASYAAHKYNEARVDFSAVLQSEPENAAAMGRLVHTFLAMENPVAAQGMLDRMADLGKLPPDAAVLYADADYRLGDFDKAISRVENIKSSEAYRILANSLLATGKEDTAVEAFAKGRNAPGPKGDLLAANVQYLLVRGKYAQATELANLAIRYRPVTHDSYMAMGNVATSQKRPKEALVWYTRALKAYPESRSALIARITTLGMLERYDELRPLLKSALARSSNDPELIYLDAVLAAEGGKWDKVRDLLQPMEMNLSNMPMANMLYSKAMMELGHGEQARIRLSSQLLRDPGNRDVRLLLAQAKMAVGDADGAVETLQPVVDGNDATKEERALFAKAEAAAGGA